MELQILCRFVHDDGDVESLSSLIATVDFNNYFCKDGFWSGLLCESSPDVIGKGVCVVLAGLIM